MTPESDGLHAYVAALAQRERALLRWGAALRTLLLVAASFTFLVIAARWDLPRGQAVALLVGGFGVGSWVAVAWPVLRSWWQAGDPLRQARLVEAREPGLEGRLITVVERPGGPRDGESAEILALVARKAGRAVVPHPPERVHDGQATRRLAGWTTLAWVAAFALALLSSRTGGGVLAWWAGGDAVAAIADGAEGDPGAPAKVGDITLRYVYPPYTGLEPYEVANSTGEAHAPPGTRVEVVARSATAVEGAALVAYDEPALDARVVDGRVIEASFVVQPREGAYHLVTYLAGETRSSADFPIVPEPDLPPEVSIHDVPEVVEVPIDSVLSLGWIAKDDFGVSRVVLEVDGQEVEPDLRRVRERQAEVSGQLSRSPFELGMTPGNTYELVIAAWDNDTVSGTKVGRSVSVRVIVLGEDGSARMTPELRKELRDLLVSALADHLEEPFPPGRSSADYARWGEAVSKRYAPIAEFVDAFRSRRGRLIPDLTTTDLALDAARKLIRYTQVSFIPGNRETANEASVDAATAMREEALVALEVATLDIDRLIALFAFRELLASAKLAAEAGHEVDGLVQSDQSDAIALTLSIDQFASMFAELAGLTASLDEGGMKSLVEGRVQEAGRLLDATRAAVLAKDVARARPLASRLAQRLDELVAVIEEEIERMKEQAQKQKSGADKLLEELKAILEAQNTLAAELGEGAAMGAEARGKAVQAAWERVKQQADALRGLLLAFDEGLERDGRSFNERELVSWAEAGVDDVISAAQMHDLLGANLAAEETDRAWVRYTQRHALFAQRDPALVARGPGVRQIEAVQSGILRLHELLEVIRRLDAAPDPALREVARGLQGRQRELGERMEAAADDARRKAREMAVTPQGLEEAVTEAVERMGQAAGDLGAARAEQARGSQRVASRRVQDAIDALQQAMQAASRQQRELEEGGGAGGPGGEEPGGGGRTEGNEDDPAPFRMPEPEEFQTPEQYRQALLEGMEGQVPEEYRAMKRRYYEELVHQ